LLDEAAFAASLEARPTAISLALGHRPDLIKRVHQAGLRVLHQVHTVTQARQVAESGVDVIIAQGSEAGGNCAMVASSVLIPQVVDAVAPIPVVAAGGIADGRGLAAALVLGAVGANIGTRFLASEEACVDAAWKQRILGAQSEDAVQLTFWQELFGAPGAEAFDVVPRALRTPFSEEWLGREVGGDAERLKAEIVKAVRSGRIHELAPFTGQATGLIRSISPARDVIDAMVTQAEDVLRRASHVMI
jgi:enoyl-[acyl-carrier protein] reductase II